MVVLSVSSGYLISHSSLEKLFKGGTQVQVINNPDGSYSVKVPASQVPTSSSGLTNAPAAQLLPAHWQGGDASAGAPDQVQLTPTARAQLAGTALAFLKRWETFPKTPTGRDYARWRKAVSPFVSPGSAGEVLGRSESYAPKVICPKSPCVVGSTWYAGYPSTDPVTVRSLLSGGVAYVTAYGLIQYHDPRGYLNGKIQLREYGLILREDAGTWKVQRAVADSLR